MASAPFEPVTALVDSDGLLVRADEPLAALQRAAGSDLGHPLAIPQLESIARLARKLGVVVSRPALAASAEADIDLWVRAEPGEGEVRLTVESWVENPPREARWPAADLLVPAAGGDGDRIELDSDLRIVTLGGSLSERIGAGRADLAGQPLTRFVQLEPAGDGAMPLLSALGHRRSFEGQPATVRASGESVLLSGEIRLDPNGGVAGVALRLGRDAASEAGENSWVGASGLEELIRLPIGRIVAEARAIAERTQGPLRSDYAGYANDILTASRHLLDVVGSLGGDRGGDSAPLDLAILAAEAADLVQAQALTAGVVLELEGETTLAVRGDRRAITQILVNLVGNAVRYSPRGGKVQIIAEKGGSARLTIADEGPGVAAADRERIFEPFERASERENGAGLGLAISRRLAREMGGDVILERAAKGARFTLMLPLA